MASSASAASKSVHDGQRLVVDLDQRRGLLGDLGGRRRDPGDDVALEAHHVLREQPAVLDHAAVEHVRHVLVGHDGEHAGQRARLRHVDPRDPRVRVVGVAELRRRAAGEREVGRVAARARHLLLAVRADERPRFLDRRHRQLSFVGVCCPYPIRERRAGHGQHSVTPERYGQTGFVQALPPRASATSTRA